LDGTVTPWDNQAYAFLGDTTNGNTTTVIFPTNAFHLIPHTFVHFVDTIKYELPLLNQNLTIFQPLPNNNANAALGSAVTTCNFMYLPM
jgi:hypothetical protein